jgi:hypothetical protein
MSRWVEERIAELSEEIRSYPTPIARCDLHLPALIEERAVLISQLNQEGPCSANALWTNDGGFTHAA